MVTMEKNWRRKGGTRQDGWGGGAWGVWGGCVFGCLVGLGLLYRVVFLVGRSVVGYIC